MRVGVRETNPDRGVVVGLVVGSRILAVVAVGARMSGGVGAKASVGKGSTTTSGRGDAVAVGVTDGAFAVAVGGGAIVGLAAAGVSGVSVASEIAAVDGRNLDPATKLAKPIQ